jgi:hypothetical protein
MDRDEHTTSVGFNLRAMRQAASTVRERLAQETLADDQPGAGTLRRRLRAHQLPGPDLSLVQAVQHLDELSAALAAITGAQA